MAKKPTIYIDANVISMMFYRGVNMHSVNRRILTEEWWESERQNFDVWASARTEYELANGVYRGQDRAIAAVRKMKYLPLTKQAKDIAAKLVESKVIPPTEPGDSQHLGTAIAHDVDYLMTWNYAHLVNPAVESKLKSVAKGENWRMPLLVSPESIPWESYGSQIQRRD